MIASVAENRLISLSWVLQRLAGPLFEKELRVASRRRKSYALRFAYVSALTVVVAVVWYVLAYEGQQGLITFQASRMGVVGRYLVVALVWFQFVAAQFAAVILLGDAISVEMRRNTLHILAVTPISGLGIVWGKLASGLLPVLMLLATSLPLLAVVRVFGAVPYDYVLSGVCITVTATVFIGALNLLTSAFHGRGRGLTILMIWYLAFLLPVVHPVLRWLGGLSPTAGTVVRSIMLLVSPSEILIARTLDLLRARPGTGLSSWWPLHCLILLAGSVVVLWFTGRRVRRMALEPGSGCARGYRASNQLAADTWDRESTATGRRKRPRLDTAIRRVEGTPVLWKELRNFTVFGSRRPLVVYGAPAALACLVGAAVTGIIVTVMGYDRLSALVTLLAAPVLGLHFGVVMVLAPVAAGRISKEREARTLPVLLATSLGEGAIVRDKAVATFRRSLPALVGFLALAVFLAFLAVAVNMIGPLDVARGAGLYVVGLAGIVPFHIGSGLYCGARFRTTATATLVCSLISLLGLFALLGIALCLVVPLVKGGSPAWLTASGWVVAAAAACAGVGLVFLWRAARRLRRHAF